MKLILTNLLLNIRISVGQFIFPFCFVIQTRHSFSMTQFIYQPCTGKYLWITSNITIDPAGFPIAEEESKLLPTSLRVVLFNNLPEPGYKIESLLPSPFQSAEIGFVMWNELSLKAIKKLLNHLLNSWQCYLTLCALSFWCEPWNKGILVKYFWYCVQSQTTLSQLWYLQLFNCGFV